MKRFAAAGSLLLLLSTAAPLPAIDLLYPNGGESLTQGTGCVIVWDTAGVAGDVALDYSADDGVSWHPIAAAAANDGAYPWVLPHATSSQYRVRATDIAAAAVDESDAAFSVTGSTLRVQYPNDGNNDDLLGGRAIEVRWNSFGDVQAVKIEYSYTNGSTWQTLVDSTPNDGRHPWTPAPPDYVFQALIRVTDVDGSPSDTSDTPFEIFAPGPGTVTFTVTVPALPAGEFVSIARGERVDRMTQIASNQWRLTLGGFGWGEAFSYRYCRNGERGAGVEDRASEREFTATGGADQITDTVGAWRWWPGPAFTLDTSAHENTPPAARAGFMSGVMLPDWWSSHDPWAPLVAPTLDWMVQDTRAKWVELVTIAEITSFAPPTFWGAGALSIPEGEFTKLVGEAHARGLKVYLYPGEVTFVSNPLAKPYGEAWWRAYAAQWRAVLLRWASLAEANGVEMLGFRMWPSLYDVDAADLPIVDLLAQELLAEVRAVYTGSIAIDWNPGLAMDVFGMGDYLNTFIWDGHLAPVAEFSPTVAGLRAAVSAALDPLQALAADYGKSVVLGQYTARSFDGAAGGIDPGGLTESDFSAFQPGNPSLVVDLQEQADALEAMLHEITGKSWIAGAFSFGAFYWDSVDKDLNIRAKPAETVVAKWYGWLDPARVTVTVGTGTGGTTEPRPGAHVAAAGAPFTVTAVPDSGYEFTGWTGCDDVTGATCTVTPAGDAAVSAAFAPLVYSVSTAVTAGSGTLVCDTLSPQQGSTVTCTLTPAAGFYLGSLTDNGADVLGAAAGVWVKTLAIAGVVGNHALEAAFAASTPRVSETFTGLSKWTKHGGTWTLGGGAVSSAAATDALLVYGVPAQLRLLRDGTLFVDAKLGGTAATANAALLFSYLGKTKYRYVRLQPGKVLVGQLGAWGGVTGTVKGTAAYAVALNTWYQLRLDLGANGSVKVAIRKRGATAWKQLAFSGGFSKFPTAVSGGAGLGALKAVASFDNFSVWDPARPPK